MNRQWRIIFKFLLEILLIITAFVIYSQLIDILARDKRIDYGPDVIKLDKVQSSDASSLLYKTVTYNHRYHARMLKDCTICHHHFELHVNDKIVPAEKCDLCHGSPGFTPKSQNLPCDICHDPKSISKETMVELGDGRKALMPDLVEAFHEECINCHKMMKGPLECNSCHPD